MVTAQSPIDANVARSPQNGLGRLAAWCYDHRRRVLAGWLLAVVVVIGLAQWAGSQLDNNFALGSSPSQQAQNLLVSRFPSQKGDSADVVLRSPAPLDSPANAATIDRLVRSLQPLAHVSGVQSPLAPGASRQLSPDRRIGFVVVQFDAKAADLPASAARRVIDTARGIARPGLQVAVGGAPVEQVVSAAPGSSAMIGLVAAIVVMLLAFGSVVAMGLPIITALVGVGMGFGILVALSHLLTVPTFGPDMMVMIGLGVGIDYALFVVTRYRQGLAERQPPRDAAIVALSTAGRAVLFAGATVVIALLGLFVVGLPFMDGLAVGDDRRGRPGAGRRAHPFACDLRLRRDGHRPAAHPRSARQARRHHKPGVLEPLERNGAEAAMDLRRLSAGGAGGAGGAAFLDAPGVQRRRQRPDLAHHPAGLRRAGRRASAPGSTGPSSSRPTCRGPHAQAGIAQLGARLSHVPGVAVGQPADRERRP